jgi:hypothetical protein
MEGRLKVGFLSVHRHSLQASQGACHNVEPIISSFVSYLWEVCDSREISLALLTGFWLFHM